ERVKRRGRGWGEKNAKAGSPADEQPVSFWAFFGYFALPQQQLTSCRRCSCAVQPAPPKLPSTVRGSRVEQRRQVMNTFAKVALCALMSAGSATAPTAAMTSPAEARGGFSFSFGYPGYGGY